MAYMTASQLSQQYQSVLKPTNKPEHEISQVTSTEDKYEVRLNITFEPDELSVKVIDRYIHIEGKHEEKNDKIGFFTRTFTRRYFLPDGVQAEAIRCTFSVEKSILTVSAPIVSKKPLKELTIPIIVIDQKLQPQKSHQDKHEKEKHHHEKQKRQQHPEKTPKSSGMIPPPAVASTSNSNSRKHHHHHHQEKQIHHQHHYHQYPSSQMHF